MERRLATESVHELTIDLGDYEGGVQIKISKTSKYKIFLGVNEIFVLQRAVNNACREILNNGI